MFSACSPLIRGNLPSGTDPGGGGGGGTGDTGRYFLYGVGDGHQSVFGFSTDAAGTLTPLEGSPFSMSLPGYGSWAIAVDPLNRFVYAPSWTGSGGENYIAVLKIDPETGALVQTDEGAIGFPQNGAIEDFIAEPQGRFVYAIVSSEVRGFQVGDDGSLTPVPGTAPSIWATYNRVGVATDPQGKFLYVTEQSGEIRAYTIDQTTGELAEISGSPYHTPDWTRLKRIKVSADGKYLYATEVDNDTGYAGIAIFPINPTTGALGSPFGPPPPTESYTEIWGFDFTNAGRWFYSAVQDFSAGHTELHGYTVTPATGALTPGLLTSSVTIGSDSVYGLVVHPTGVALYTVEVDGWNNPAWLHTLNINSTSGALSESGEAPQEVAPGTYHFGFARLPGASLGMSMQLE